MLPAVSVPMPGTRVAEIRFTDRADHGRAAVRVDAPAPWTMSRQVHGSSVVEVARAGDARDREADGLVTAALDTPLAIETADCAPVVLIGTEQVAVVHAGWRGLVAGVLERAVAALDSEPSEISAHLGPVIRPHCYAFGAAQLDAVADRLGAEVRSRTASGDPALDLPGAVAATLGRIGVGSLEDHGYDTADLRFFSYRRRRDADRQFTVAWMRAR